MELSFNEPEGPPGRGAISQLSFIQLHPHASPSPGAGLGTASV